MPVMGVDMRKEPISGPYLVRMGGWTLERYLAEAPESARWEYVRGEVVMHSPATAEHQDLVRFLLRLLDGYCEAQGWGKVLMGPAAVQVLPEVVREPDLFVLPPEAAEQAQGVPIRARPVLIIEVVSPATRSMDLGEKAQEYGQGGVDEYGVVDAERREVIAHRRGGIGLGGGAGFPGTPRQRSGPRLLAGGRVAVGPPASPCGSLPPAHPGGGGTLK
jgi:Uma2 family endonuclease